ncbi:MAG: DinB family protein [Pseudonocardiales bacterium]|nr:DinB family protein [Pseudonocardiales bacterium]
MTIEPDTKDWTWVLDQHCPDCGFDAWSTARSGLADAIAANARRMGALLDAAGAPALRPRPSSWSLLEYGAHVRDVHLIFTDRLILMLEHDSPAFANWDQDEAARLGRYGEQQPTQVAREIVTSGERFAATLRNVGDDDWDRPGLRSNGSRFTVETLARYALHDLAHHWHDVTGERAGREPEGATTMTTTIPAQFTDLLENPNLGVLATIRLDGAPSTTPMWFLWENGQLLFTHTTYRAKIAELEANPLATLLVIDPDNRQRYLQVRARLAGITPDPTGAFYVRLARRYGAADPAPPRDAPDRVIIALDPTGTAKSANA